ncbi:MAG TPA: hypothetical protein VKA64_04830, partial [Gammaproteobacteria bacterium]|nr:hypothetical protein [Gammaproteobacteria bacterium]
YVSRALAEINAKTAEDAEEVKRLELERLDRMLLSLWPKVTNGDPQAVEKALKVSERRARLLGIDAPTRGELSGPGGGPLEVSGFAALMRQMEEGGDGEE